MKASWLCYDNEGFSMELRKILECKKKELHVTKISTKHARGT